MQLQYRTLKQNKRFNLILISIFLATLIITLVAYMDNQIYKLTPNRNAWKSQMIKGVHPDF